MYEPINTSAPTAADLELDTKLEAFMGDNVPVMTKADLRRREQVLGKIRNIFLQVIIPTYHTWFFIRVVSQVSYVTCPSWKEYDYLFVSITVPRKFG